MTETRVHSPANTPVKFELIEANDYRNYLLHNPTEIQFVLRGLIRSGDLITAYIDEGNDFLLTVLLEVNDDGLVFDYGASEEMNRKALAASRLTLIGTHDMVKIQFSLPGVEETTSNDKPLSARRYRTSCCGCNGASITGLPRRSRGPSNAC